MIDRLEVETKSREFEINPQNVEKDYVFGWFLYGIFTTSGLKDTIFLKGGNALRKGYFENTRYSSDLDFGIPGDIDPNILLSEINKVCDFIKDRTQVVFVEGNKVEEKFSATDAPIPGLKVYEVRVYFRDFYGNRDHLKLVISMDITRFDKVLLPIQTVNLIHPYSDADVVSCQIRCMKLEEIIATKLKCILQRQNAADLFDYAYSIKLLGGNLNKEEVVRTLVKKTIFDRNPQVLKKILLKTSFDYFRVCWSKTINCAKQFLINADDAITIFLGDLETLFGIYPDNGYEQFAYFGPELRVPIMKAGRTQTLLRIRYKGSERIVEPYSLKYLQRRNGDEREYLFVYNRSGGDNLPGIRCFVAENVEAIENTEDKFVPQYPIELSKAGETPENPYLFDPNKPIRSTLRTKYFGPRYVYQCGYCGRKFTKHNNDGRLGPHKSKTGYPCGGRTGYYVTMKYL